MSDERIYPCARCGVMRSKAEGGTVFTVCDECWDATRMFPECTGTTHLAPTNSQCNACGRYGQRCDRKVRAEDGQ